MIYLLFNQHQLAALFEPNQQIKIKALGSAHFPDNHPCTLDKHLLCNYWFVNCHFQRYNLSPTEVP